MGPHMFRVLFCAMATAAGQLEVAMSPALEKGLRSEAAADSMPQAFGASTFTALHTLTQSMFSSSSSSSSPGGKCLKPWQQNEAPFKGVCPYGSKLPGDVTWPEYSKAKHLPHPYDLPPDLPSEFLIKAAVLYSFIPYVFAVVLVFKFLMRRGTRELAFVSFLGFLVCCNEVLVKPFVTAPRPALSCLLSCGMPSSHAAIAIGTITLSMSHSMFRTAPVQIAAILQMEFDGGSRADFSSRPARSFRHGCKSLLQEAMAGVPFDEPSQEHVMILSLTWIMLLLPVPICRIIIADHTPGQVLVGGIVGGIAAIIWSAIKKKFERRFQNWLGEEWWYGRFRLLTHNLGRPCYSALKDIAHEARNGNFSNRANAIRQLQWYELETLLRIRTCHADPAEEDDHERYLKFRWCLLRDFMDKFDPDSSTAMALAHSMRVSFQEQVFMDAMKAYWSWVHFDTLSQAELDNWRSLGRLQGAWLRTRLQMCEPRAGEASRHLTDFYLGGAKDRCISRQKSNESPRRRKTIQELSKQCDEAKELPNAEQRAAALEEVAGKLQHMLEDDRHPGDDERQSSSQSHQEHRSSSSNVSANRNSFTPASSSMHGGGMQRRLSVQFLNLPSFHMVENQQNATEVEVMNINNGTYCSQSGSTIEGEWKCGSSLRLRVGPGEEDNRCTRYKALASAGQMEGYLILLASADAKIRIEFETDEFRKEWPHALDGQINADATLITWTFGADSHRKHDAHWLRVAPSSTWH